MVVVKLLEDGVWECLSNSQNMQQIHFWPQLCPRPHLGNSRRFFRPPQWLWHLIFGAFVTSLSLSRMRSLFSAWQLASVIIVHSCSRVNQCRVVSAVDKCLTCLTVFHSVWHASMVTAASHLCISLMDSYALSS